MNYRLSILILAVVAGVITLLPGTSTGDTAHAQDDVRCFPETGECIAGVIRQYWEQNGGLPVFGYPITPLQVETIGTWSGPTQWFQRDRLEDHGVEGVLAGRLGVELLALQGRPWEIAFERVSAAEVPASCAYFPQTGHSLCEPFLSYWADNGGVERFGYPVTEPMAETIDTWTGTVQYFERRRMEFHTELPGSPVLLGLLGQEVLTDGTPEQPIERPDVTPPTQQPPPQDFTACVDQALNRGTTQSRILRDAYDQIRPELRAVMGCPTVYLSNRESSRQRMERGDMLWIDNGYQSGVPASVLGRYIYVISNPGPTYGKYIDTWNADTDPYTYDLNPPGGLHAPVGGFGKLWLRDAGVSNGVGWAIQEFPTESRAEVVIFDNIYNDLNNLGAMILFEETNTVYVFGRLDRPDEVQIIFR